MPQYCQDCNRERDNTSWSDHFRTRLCMECYYSRCEEDLDYAKNSYELWVEAGKP